MDWCRMAMRRWDCCNSYGDYRGLCPHIHWLVVVKDKSLSELGLFIFPSVAHAVHDTVERLAERVGSAR